MDVALDGVTGLHLAVSQPHDVVVLDLMLPGLDGLSVCRQLRRDAQSPVPVLTNPDLTLQADAGVVDTLVSNLVRNAFAHTAAGRVVVLQGAHTVTVTDTGKRICDRYGWRVRLESGEERGTTVTVGFG